MSAPDPRAVHAYWFGDTSDWAETVARNSARWFQHGAKLDDEIRERFGEAVDRARDGALEHWQDRPETILALVLLLDQFPRHVFRGSAEAFASDDQALATCRHGIDRGLDERLASVEQSFFYLPLQHAEDREVQALSVRMMQLRTEQAPDALQAYMRNSLGYAESHRQIVERFGRYPHRNQALSRQSTPQEQAYLDGGGRRFGQ